MQCTTCHCAGMLSWLAMHHEIQKYYKSTTKAQAKVLQDLVVLCKSEWLHQRSGAPRYCQVQGHMHLQCSLPREKHTMKQGSLTTACGVPAIPCQTSVWSKQPRKDFQRCHTMSGLLVSLLTCRPRLIHATLQWQQLESCHLVV